MSLTRWTPGVDPFREMEEMMNRLPSTMTRGDLQSSFVPAIDVYETKDAVMVEAPLAGVDPKDVSVSVDNGRLTIEGQSKTEHEMDDKNYYRKEVRSGSFFRRIGLPTSVKEDEISAEFENGILKVTCPKASPEGGKKVDVKIVNKKK